MRLYDIYIRMSTMKPKLFWIQNYLGFIVSDLIYTFFFSDLLSTQEPILLTAEKIPDEIYWQRCCQDLLTSYDSSRHGGSYKRLFLEKHLQSCIEKFIPQQTDLFDIKDLLGVMEPYIKRLEVTELLPPTLILVSITI